MVTLGVSRELPTVFARRHPLVNTGPQNRLPTVQVR